MSLRTKGITLVGFLSSILMGMSGGGFASAASYPAKISDNPDSMQDLTISHVVHDAYQKTNAELRYQVDWCDEKPALSTSTSFSAVVDYLKFDYTPRNDNLDTTVTKTVPFGDYEFRAPGTYEFCVFEVKGDPDRGVPADPTMFKVYVDVVTELNDNGEATGNLIATLVPQALNMTTGEKGELIFETTAKKTSMQFTHSVTGIKADRNHYFPYDVTFPQNNLVFTGSDFQLEGLDASFTDGYSGEMRTNPTQIIAGGGKTRVYLKDGQTLRIGRRNGMDDLPPDTLIQINAVSEHPLEEAYAVEINGRAKSSIKSYLKLPLGENPTEEEILAYQTNNDIKIVRKLEQDAVSTGLVARVMPFVALIILAGAVGFVAYRSDKKKRVRKL